MELRDILLEVYKAGNNSAQMPEDWEIVNKEFSEWFDYNGERLVKILNLHSVVGQSAQLKGDYRQSFLDWKNKYFIYEQKTYDYKSINKKDEYTLHDLHRMYQRAMLESPFN